MKTLIIVLVFWGFGVMAEVMAVPTLSVSVDRSEIVEGQTAVFTLTLSETATEAISANVYQAYFVSHTNKIPSGYNLQNNITVNFAAGERVKTLSFPTVDDSDISISGEFVLLSINDGVGYTTNSGESGIRIYLVDDDAPLQLSLLTAGLTRRFYHLILLESGWIEI